MCKVKVNLGKLHFYIVFANSTPNRKGITEHCTEDLGVGIRLAQYNKQKIPRIPDMLNYKGQPFIRNFGQIF